MATEFTSRVRLAAAMSEEEVWRPQEALQTDSAQRKLWLVKVSEQGFRQADAAHPAQPCPCLTLCMLWAPDLPTAAVSCAPLPWRYMLHSAAAPCPTQVPNFVAKRWKACCEQSAEQGQQQGRKLATLRLVQAPDESGATKTQYQLQLDGERAGGGAGGLGALSCWRVQGLGVLLFRNVAGRAQGRCRTRSSYRA